MFLVFYDNDESYLFLDSKGWKYFIETHCVLACKFVKGRLRILLYDFETYKSYDVCWVGLDSVPQSFLDLYNHAVSFKDVIMH